MDLRSTMSTTRPSPPPFFANAPYDCAACKADGDDFGPDSAKAVSLEDVSTSPELLAEMLVRLRGTESAEAVLKRALEHLGSVCTHHHLGAVSISDECDEHCTCASCLQSPSRRPTVNKPRTKKVHDEAKQSGVQDE